MRIIRFYTLARGVVLGVVMFTSTATAQNIGIGTTKGGATAQISTAISKVVSENAKVQVRPQAMANTQQYVPLVNSGKIELGLANVPQTRYSVSGKGMSEGKPNPNLRMIVTLFPFRAGLMVSGESGIKGAADLKGRKIPAFKERALGEYIIGSFLKSGGLSFADVDKVPTSNFPKMWKMFKEGHVDTAIVAVGSKPAFDFEATFGSVNFLNFGGDNQAVAAEYLPGSYLLELSSDKTKGGTPGEADGVFTLGFDYALFAHKDVADDVVKEVVDAMYNNADALKATGPLWKRFDPANMAKDVGLEFHPSAIAYYKDKGIWNRKIPNHRKNY